MAMAAAGGGRGGGGRRGRGRVSPELHCGWRWWRVELQEEEEVGFRMKAVGRLMTRLMVKIRVSLGLKTPECLLRLYIFRLEADVSLGIFTLFFFIDII